MTAPLHDPFRASGPAGSAPNHGRLGRRRLLVGAAAATGLVVASAAPASAAPESAQGLGDLDRWQEGVERYIAQRQVDWIFTWDKEPDDGPFDFDTAFADYYDFTGDDVILYDDLAPDQQTAYSAQDYGALFTDLFNALQRAEHAIETEPSVVTSGLLAASHMVFLARFTGPDGSVSGIRTRSSLVFRRGWRRGRWNEWRIVREHNSSAPLGAEEIDALFADLGHD